MVSKLAHPNELDRTDTDEDLYIESCGYYHLSKENLGNLREKGGNNYYFYYVERGKSTCIINGKRQTAREGDVVFYNYRDRQEYTHLAEFNTQVYWLHFNGKKAAAILADLGITDSTILHSGRNVGEYFEGIIRDLTYQNEHYQKSAVGYLYLLLSNVARPRRQSRDGLMKVFSMMKNMENARLTLEDYARICHLSKSQFIRSFKQRFGQTPIQYKNQIITDNARWYLENTDSHVSEIAAVLRFENAYYFSTFFKKHTGFSPSGYREHFYSQR